LARESSSIQVFVINLDVDRDRLRRFARTMAGFDAPFGRWRATPGSELDVRRFGRRPLSPGLYVTGFRGWSANEAACGVSHVRLLQHIVRVRIPWAIVMEDDGFLVREMPSDVGSWDVPQDADIVLLNDRATLGAIRHRGRYFSFGDVSGGAGTEAYLVSLAGARKLLRVLYPLRDPLDFQMYSHFESIQRLDVAPFHWKLPRNPFALDTSLKAYRLVPALVRHANHRSSIGNQRHPSAHRYCRLLLGMDFGPDPVRAALSSADWMSCAGWMACGGFVACGGFMASDPPILNGRAETGGPALIRSGAHTDLD
jgi:glycosyl transferase family 25